MKWSFADEIILSYRNQERAQSVADIKHNLIRETLKYFSIDRPVEIASFADIPSYGTGLGSSSSFVCCLVFAISKLLGQSLSAQEAAKIGSYIEIELCNSNIGRQDHYLCSLGGCNELSFRKDQVAVKPVYADQGFVRALFERSGLYYTAKTRSASETLSSYNIGNEESKIELLKKSVDLVPGMSEAIANGGIERAADDIRTYMKLKSELSANILDQEIEAIMATAKACGSVGEKILGAGAGGFLFIILETTAAKIKFDEQSRLFQLPFEVDEIGLTQLS